MAALAQVHPIADAKAQTPRDLISIRGLDKTYAGGSVHALSNIDLDIKDGEFVCVVGPSGCGKSTLLRILAGLDDYDTGEAALDGKAITGPSRDVGVVFQAANLLPWLTVRQNVALPLRVGGKQTGQAEDIDRLLDVAGLRDFGERFPTNSRAACSSAPESAARWCAAPASC